MILEDHGGVEVLKKRGLRVLRARITKQSRLIGRTAEETKFRETYKAAIVAVQQGGKNVVQPLSSLKFNAGDTLVLQVSDDSLLLSPPSNAGSKARMFSTFTSWSAKSADESKPPNNTEHKDIEVGRVVCILESFRPLVCMIRVLTDIQNATFMIRPEGPTTKKPLMKFGEILKSFQLAVVPPSTRLGPRNISLL